MENKGTYSPEAALKKELIKAKTEFQNRSFGNLVKKIVYAYFLIFPFVGGYLPYFSAGNSYIDFQELVYIFLATLLIYFFVINHFQIVISKITFLLLIYFTYNIFNQYFNTGKFAFSINLYSFGILGCLILFENLEFNLYDLKILTHVLVIVSTGIVIVSFIQVAITPFFYLGIHRSSTEGLELYKDLEGIYRNNSIFSGISAHDAGIAMGCLSLYFLFLNLYKIKNLFLAIFIGLCCSCFFTYSKWVWGIPLIGCIFFIYYKYKSYNLILMPVIGLLLFFTIVTFSADIKQSKIYQNRIVTDTYKGRTESTQIYFDKFFPKRPLFGYGITSWIDKDYTTYLWHGIHVAYFDIMFRSGIIGLAIYLLFWFQYFARSWLICKVTDNPIFIVFVTAVLYINSTALFDPLYFYGYMLMFFYLDMYYNLFLVKGSKYKPEQVYKLL